MLLSAAVVVPHQSCSALPAFLTPLPFLSSPLTALPSSPLPSPPPSTHQARETIRHISLSLIAATRDSQSRRSTSPRAASPSSSGGKGRPVGVAPGSFLGLLLSAKDQQGHALSDRQMAAQANVFTLAGYEVRGGHS